MEDFKKICQQQEKFNAVVDINAVRQSLPGLSDREKLNRVRSLARRGCKTTEEVFNRIESVRDLIPNLRWELEKVGEYLELPVMVDGKQVDTKLIKTREFYQLSLFINSENITTNIQKLSGPDYVLQKGSLIPEAV